LGRCTDKNQVLSAVMTATLQALGSRVGDLRMPKEHNQTVFPQISIHGS
jgi:hypothetical protein